MKNEVIMAEVTLNHFFYSFVFIFSTIVDQIDKDHDDLISKTELRNWIIYVSKK